MKRRIFIFCIVMLFTLCTFAICASADNTLAQFSLSDESALSGETISIDVYFDSGVNVNSIALTGITYDTTILEFTGFSNLDTLKSKSAMWVDGMNDDVSALTIVAPLKTPEVYDDNFCTLNFTVKPDAPSCTTTVTANSVVKNDSTVVSSSVSASTITIRQHVLVSGVSLDKSQLTLNKGDSSTLIATVVPDNAVNKGVAWSSSNTTVATVDTNGVVTAVGAGNATITVTTEDGNHSASCTVTVTEPAPVFSPTIAYSMQANLTLKSEVFMNVCFKLENLDGVDPSTLCDNVGVLIWKAEEMPSEDMATVDNCSYVIEGAEWSTANSRFEARGVGIPAKELGDTLCFRAFYKKSDGTYNYGRIISNYSPKKYCYNKLKDDTTAEDALMVAILNYGAAAQVHFGHNTNSLMNSDLSEAQKNYVWDGSLVRSDWSIPTEKEGNLTRSASITTRGGNLTLLGAIDYTYYAGISSEYTVASAKMLCWTEDDYNKASVLTPANATVVDDMEYVTANKRYEYTYKGLPARKMFSPIYGCAMITDTNGNVHYSGVVAYCPERFAYINSSKSNQPALANLAKTIAIYGDAARNYFGD